MTDQERDAYWLGVTKALNEIERRVEDEPLKAVLDDLWTYVKAEHGRQT